VTNRKENMEQSEIVEKLAAFFAEQTVTMKIRLAYLFGSRAQGSVGPMSDFDIAVLFSASPTPNLRYEFVYNLKKNLMAETVDLVVLNTAPIELQYAAIASGTIICETNFGERVEYEASTLSRYGDFLPILRRQRQEILEEKKSETGIQRYRAALGKTQHLLEKIRAF
jgi:predicted nucleotidyltransferase